MIEINNLTASFIDKELLKRVAQIVLKGENKKEADLSIVFVGEGRIKKINRKYRKKDRVTDVLAFGQSQESKVKSQKFPILPKKELELGELVICLSEVKKNAKSSNLDSNEELARVLIHGILHLLGYEHEKSEKKVQEMERKQEHYLSQI